MILYLCVLENNDSNYIHENQIVPLQINSDIDFLFISPLLIAGKNEFRLNKKKYTSPKIKSIKIPFLSYHYFLNPFLIPFLLLFTTPIILFFLKKNNINIIHCRTHLSALCGIFAKKILNKTKIIADIRGHYPEEGVIINRWKENSIRFRIWKKIERFIINESDEVFTISENMSLYYQNLSQKNCFYLPAIVDTNLFYFDPKLRLNFRKNEKITDNEYVYIYTGSLGLWHTIDYLFQTIDAHITENKIGTFRLYILCKNISLDKVPVKYKNWNIIIKSVSPPFVNSFLCGADFGVLPGSNKNSKSIELIYTTMISSKAEEYLSTGLKIIYNPKIKELTNLLSSYPNKDEFIASHDDIRMAKARFYSLTFSLDFISKEHQKVYTKLST